MSMQSSFCFVSLSRSGEAPLAFFLFVSIIEQYGVRPKKEEETQKNQKKGKKKTTKTTKTGLLTLTTTMR